MDVCFVEIWETADANFFYSQVDIPSQLYGIESSLYSSWQPFSPALGEPCSIHNRFWNWRQSS